MKTKVRRILHRFGIDIIRYKVPNSLDRAVVTLKPGGVSIGTVLLSYIVEPLLQENGRNISNTHTHYWESVQISDIFLDMGYTVDVIDYRNCTFTPQKHYSYFVGARTNFERISKLCNSDCIKIVHLDTAHWVFNNYATHKRLMNLLHRKGVAIKGSSRIIEQNSGIEYADYATILGNEFTIGTYSYAQKPLFKIPISTCAVYPWDDNKDFDACSRNFLWFGSAGAVHRGLDLLLEIFSTMNDQHLYICGPIEEEKDFVRAYYNELYQTPNIHMIGWVDVNSERFIEVLGNCVGLVYPSCAEGQCGAVVNCLHAGLIPIISFESGVDVGDFGIMLKECSLEEIRSSVEYISGMPVEKLKKMALKSWEFARARHTRGKFAAEFRKAIEIITDDHGKKGSLFTSDQKSIRLS